MTYSEQLGLISAFTPDLVQLSLWGNADHTKLVQEEH